MDSNTMIPISMHTGLVVYLMIWLITLTILWAREIWRNQKHDWSLVEDKLCVCDSCHLAFLVKPNINISRCPRCNEMCIIRTRRNRL